MRIEMIMAMDQNGAIGRGNDLIIKNKEDMEFFKKRTAGKTLIMGRKTWDSLGRKPLPGRPAVVISTRPLEVSENAPEDNFFIAADEHEALRIAKRINLDVMIIGGAQIYRVFQEKADIIWITHWDTVIPDADTFVSGSIYDGRHGETIARLTHADYTGMIRAYTWDNEHES